MRNEKERIKDKIRSAAKKHYMLNQLGGCCSKCGETRIQVLEFHHVNPSEKETLLSILNKCRIEKIKKELFKCVVLCANCHRLEHFYLSSNRTKLNYVHYLKKQKCVEYKNIKACAKCGYSHDDNYSVFDFHHNNVGVKNFEISHRARILERGTKELLPEVKRELDNCDMICVNCHRIIHSDMLFYQEHYEEIIKKSKEMENWFNIDYSLVKTMYEVEKKTITEISKILKISKASVGEYTRSLGYGSKMEDIKIDRTKIIKLYDDGYSNKEIAISLGCAPSVISNYLNKIGLKYNNKIKTRKLKAEYAELKELYTQIGMTKMAEMFNVTHESIRLRLIRHGIYQPMKRKKS